VCHHQGQDLLRRSIETLSKQKGSTYEILIITSRPVEELDPLLYDYPNVRIYHQPGEPAIKRNLGVQHAQGDYIAFFDDDIEADPDALREMYKVCRPADIGMVFGKLKNMEFRNKFDEAGGYLTWTGFIWARAESGIEDTGQFEVAETIFAGKSAACMIKRRVYRKIGGFDEAMGILGEESDVAWRVWLSGLKVYYAPQSITYHAFNTRFKPKDYYTHGRVYFNGCRNYITMLIKNLSFWNLVRIVPFHVCVWLLSAIGMGLVGKFSASYHIFRGLFYLTRNLKNIHLKRKSSQDLRQISDKDLFPYIYRSPKFGYYCQRFFRYLKVGLHG